MNDLLFLPVKLVVRLLLLLMTVGFECGSKSSMVAAGTDSVVSPADFDPKLDGVGVDASIFADLPCIVNHPERLVTSEKILAVQGSTLNYDRPNLALLLQHLDNLTVSYDTFVFFVEGVGAFRGIDDGE